MKEFLTPHRPASLETYWPHAAGSCGLANCSRAASLWRRLWARRNGVRFDGVLYCHPQCLEAAVGEELLQLQNRTPTAPPANRMPLGLLMVARGKLTYSEVAAALEAQRRARYGNIGEWIQKLGFASEQDVTAALGLQWGCPVAASLSSESSGTSRSLPFAILENFLMWPLHRMAATNTLYIACGKRVDYGALSAIEKMLGCRTQACVAAPTSIASRIERVRHDPRATEIEFRAMRDPGEMVRIAISYIARIGAEEVRASRLGSFTWLLLKNRATCLNLLFRMTSQAQPPQEPAISGVGHVPGMQSGEAEAFSAVSAVRRT